METLLIENLANQINEKKIPAKEKSKMRVSNENVSRGSYSRTLGQARKNIRKAIFTLLLLGYIGLHETPELLPFIEISNKIKSLVDLHTEYNTEQLGKDEDAIIQEILIVREEIEDSLARIVRSKQISGSSDL